MAGLVAVGAGSVPVSEGTHNFDIIVFPQVACKLSFEVIKNRISQMASVTVEQTKSPEYYCRWTCDSAVMKKPTVLHMTIPGSATSCKFVVVTDHARNTSHAMHDGKFSDTAIEVSEGLDVFKQHKNEVVFHRAEAAKRHLPAGAAQQEITISGRGRADSDEKAKA